MVMVTDRELIRTIAIERLEGDDYLLCDTNDCHVGEDDDE